MTTLLLLLILLTLLILHWFSTVEHFATERPSDVERSRNIRKRIEREEENTWYSPIGYGPYVPGPYGRRVAPGFYEPEVNFTLMKGKAPSFFKPSDDFLSKDITKVLSNCSARFNPNCQTIVHDLDSGKVYRYDIPAGSLINKSRINTYTSTM